MSTYIGVTAHRGCKGTLPENTLISFRQALEYDIDLIEYDVHMSLDKELVIMHDSLVSRTTGQRGALEFMTLSEIKALDAGETLYGPAYKGTPVPTLRETLEVIAACPRPVRQIVEIKDFRAEVADGIMALLREFNLRDRTIIEAGDAQMLLYLHQMYPEMELLAFPPQSMQRFDDRIYDFTKNVAFSLSSTRFKDENEMRAHMDELRARGCAIWLFSGDTPEQIERCLAFGACNITSNFPDFTIQYLREKGLRGR